MPPFSFCSGNIPPVVYGYLAGMAVLAIIGVVVQCMYTSKKAKPGEKDEWEQTVESSEVSVDALLGAWAV